MSVKESLRPFLQLYRENTQRRTITAVNLEWSIANDKTPISFSDLYLGTLPAPVHFGTASVEC